MRYYFGFFALGIALVPISFPAARADPVSECVQHIPWGPPSLTDGTQVALVCHAGYLSALDGNAKEARWVAYELTGRHTLGCFSRDGLQFKVDTLAPADDQARLKDYSRSGYDLGHLAPNQDFAWDQKEQEETFSFANVSPQLPGLNRQGWERGEEIVRDWALERGDVEVYVGPVIGPADEKLGDDAVDVPAAFFKVVVDRNTGEVIGFVMPQKAIAKGPLAPFIQSVAYIEALASIQLPLPEHFTEAIQVWPTDLAAWNAAHRQACRSG